MMVGRFMITSVRLPESRQVWKQCLGEHQHPHQTVNDTGDARQRLVGELDHRDDLAVPGVLGQVNGRAHTQRQYDQKRQQDDIQRVEDRRQDAVRAFSTLAVVVRNFQLMCGMPRTSTMPECLPPVR